jgi:DHA1 family bicyclomycin/chloramphenicol resistance-like MFS transporter
MKPIKKQSDLTIAWLLSYLSIAAVSAAMVTPALPYIEQSFTLHTGSVEWMVSIFLVGYVLGQLIYGPLANAYGRLKALNWGLNINIIGLVICLVASVSHHYLMLLAGRLVTGLGSAAGLTCTFMLINEWLPESQRKTVMASSILSFVFGIGLAVFLGGIITQYLQWQWCFIFLLLQGLWMRWGTFVFDETLSQTQAFHLGRALNDYKKALGSFQLVAFSVIWGACSSIGYCYSAAAPLIAQQNLNLSASDYGYLNMLNTLGMLLGGLTSKIFM